MSYTNADVTIEIQCKKCHRYFVPNVSNNDLDKRIVEVECIHCGNKFDAQSKDIIKAIEEKVANDIQNYFK